MSLGTHYLRWDPKNLTLSTSFAPLVYLMCKQHESLGAGLILMDAANATSKKYFGAELNPGACMSDHSDTYRSAFKKSWPNADFAQCWPHISRKWSEGEWVSKTWVHFNDVAQHLHLIHMGGHTADMKEILITECGKLWDSWGKQMNTFWNGYCMNGWDCWSICATDTPLATPSQQTQESWHKQLLISRIPAMFRGSTAHVFEVAMPQLVQMDGLLMPSVLNFDVPAIPKDMMKKALWYVEHQNTHIHAARMPNDTVGFYFLRKENPGGYKKLEKRLIEMYSGLLDGRKDARIKDFEHLADFALSFHLVMDEDEARPVPKCEANVARLDCPTCKGFKGYGICSHVIAINHVLKKFNVRQELLEIGQKACKKPGGNTIRPPPALQKAHAPKKGKGKAKALPAPVQPELDSSDEEILEALALGAQGK